MLGAHGERARAVYAHEGFRRNEIELAAVIREAVVVAGVFVAFERGQFLGDRGARDAFVATGVRLVRARTRDDDAACGAIRIHQRGRAGSFLAGRIGDVHPGLLHVFGLDPTQKADPPRGLEAYSAYARNGRRAFLSKSTRRGSSMKPLIYCAIAALVLSASAAAAQQVFKSTMPDGRIVYGEKPAPGAAKVETIETPPAKAGIGSALTPEEKARAEALTKQRQQTETAQVAKEQQLTQARAAVKEAEVALEKGKEPLPGERMGLAGGGSRLSEAYFARQKSLEEGLAKARKNLADVERTSR